MAAWGEKLSHDQGINVIAETPMFADKELTSCGAHKHSSNFDFPIPWKERVGKRKACPPIGTNLRRPKHGRFARAGNGRRLSDQQ